MTHLIRVAGCGAAIALFLGSAQAQTPRRLAIASSLDKYELVLTGPASGTVDGKPANLSALKDLWPVLNNPLGNECPTLKTPPEVTVKEGGKSRAIYLKLGLVSDGQHCLNVGGEGLAYFPVHRDFLIGPKRESLKLRSPLKIFRQGVKLLELRREGGEWVNENPESLLNWDFLERFEHSLEDYEVRLRVLPEIAKGKTKMIVQSGDQAYEFYKVTSVMWAVKKPGAAWLTASDDWSFWYEFDQGLVQERYAAEIRNMLKPETPRAERKAILDRLEGLWSVNLRDMYHKLLLRDGEDPEFVDIAMKRLRRKPSLQSAGVMVEFLNRSHDDGLKKSATQILKVQNPSGPLYKSSLPAGEKMKVLDYWNSWWRNTQSQKAR